MKDKGIKFLEEIIGKYLHDLGIRNNFLKGHKKLHSFKKNLKSKLNCAKTKNFIN